MRTLVYLIPLALWIWAFIDCLLTPEEEVRHLPKVIWVIVILLFGEVLVGSVAWLVAGRARGAGARRRGAWASGGDGGPGQERPARRTLAPDDDPEFLDSLKRANQRREEEPRRRDDTPGGTEDGGEKGR